MYASINFKTKKELQQALKDGREIRVFQPNADFFGVEVPRNGNVCLEGPHYPQPHRWYAEAILKDGIIIQVDKVKRQERQRA